MSLTIITGQRSFSRLDVTPKTKNSFEHSTAKSGSFSFKFCNILQILKYQFFI